MSSKVTLEVELHCMCLLVPDEKNGAVHVLMPCTHHGSQGNQHIAVMRYRGPNGWKYDRRLEGWALALGDPHAKKGADTSLTAPPTAAGKRKDGLIDGTVVELSRRGGMDPRVPRRLLEQPDPSVVSRITFHEGELAEAKSQDSRWIFDGQSVSIANQVTWRMQIHPDQMVWTRLDPRRRQRPLASLGNITPARAKAGSTLTLRVQVYHVTPQTLPRKYRRGVEEGLPDFSRSVLTPPEIRSHFRMFYGLVGLNDPRQQVLPMLPRHPSEDREVDPEDPDVGAPGWACLTSQANVE